MTQPFDDFDFSEFWEQSDFAVTEYLSEPFSDAVLAEIESELGYRLPAAYVAFMRVQNGGIPTKDICLTNSPTSWADNHVRITGFFGIGRQKECSLCGGCGSRFWVQEWGYPDIGVYIADCPSAGHDMIALDYSCCGADGEPQVVYIDQERDYHKTVLAPDFASFIHGLIDEDEYYARFDS